MLSPPSSTGIHGAPVGWGARPGGGCRKCTVARETHRRRVAGLLFYVELEILKTAEHIRCREFRKASSTKQRQRGRGMEILCWGRWEHLSRKKGRWSCFEQWVLQVSPPQPSPPKRERHATRLILYDTLMWAQPDSGRNITFVGT